jgi:hypothetical protein
LPSGRVAESSLFTIGEDGGLQHAILCRCRRSL